MMPGENKAVLISRHTHLLELETYSGLRIQESGVSRAYSEPPEF